MRIGRAVVVGFVAALLLVCLGGAALLGAFVFGEGGGSDGDRPTAVATLPGPAGDARALDNPIVAELYASPVPREAQAAPAVVQQVGQAVLTVITRVGRQDAGSGTGFIVAAEAEAGYVVTNNHVVEGGDGFEVVLADGASREAELVGRDALADLAVLRIPGPVPAPVPLGDSSRLQPGQRVLAIGSPLGTFTNTVTRGVVSAVDRDFPAAGYYANLVQHDAAINPGNSGGPLFNLSGEVVGVNTLGVPQDEQGNPAQGLFFAVPSNTVRQVAAALIAEGRVIYPFVGVQYDLLSGDAIAEYDLDPTLGSGIVVTEVLADTPGEAAGLAVGDVILAVEDRTIGRETTFIEAVTAFRPGEEVTMSVARGRERLDIDLTLGERASDG